jgi:hypothetical protein
VDLFNKRDIRRDFQSGLAPMLTLKFYHSPIASRQVFAFNLDPKLTLERFISSPLDRVDCAGGKVGIVFYMKVDPCRITAITQALIQCACSSSEN